MSRIVELLPDGTITSTNWTLQWGNSAPAPPNVHSALADKLPTGTKIGAFPWTRTVQLAVNNSNYRGTFGTYTLQADERCRRVRVRCIGQTNLARMMVSIGNGTTATEPLSKVEFRTGGFLIETKWGPWADKAMDASGNAVLEWLQTHINDLRLRLDPTASATNGEVFAYEAIAELDIVEKPSAAFISPFDGEVFPASTPTLRWHHQVQEAQKKYELRIFEKAVAEDDAFNIDTSTQYVHRNIRSTTAQTYRLPDGIVEHGKFYYVYIKTAVDFNGEDWWSDWSTGIEFKINARPEVIVIAPLSPVPDTAKPIVQWTYDDEEGNLQSEFRVVVLERSGGSWPGIVDPDTEVLNNDHVYDSGLIASEGSDHQIPVSLMNGSNYRAYVQVQQRVPSVLLSEWAYKEFDMAFFSPLSPGLEAFAAGEAIDVIVTPSQPNLVSADTSSIEGGVGTWQAGTNTTIAQSSAQFLDGTKSLSLTRTTSTGDASAMSSTLAGRVPVIAGADYTGMAWLKANSTTRQCRVGIEWVDVANAAISTSSGSNINDTTTGWTQAIVTATAPSNAVGARIVVTAIGAAVSEIHFVDQAQLSYGHKGAWNVGGGTVGVTLDPASMVAAVILNKLTANQASLETDTTGWVAGASTSIARSTAQALQGTASLIMTRNTTTGDATATTPMAPPTIPCHEHVEYSAIASFRAVTTARFCDIELVFYDDADVVVPSTNVKLAIADTTTGWTQATTRVVAPMGAMRMSLQVRAFGAIATEQHYVDGIGIFEGVVTTWSQGDAHALDVSDMEIRFGVALIDWLPDEPACLVHRWDFIHGEECSWAVWLLTDGKLRFDWSSDGTEATKKSATSTAAMSIPAGTKKYVRITFDENNGASQQAVSFFNGDTLATATTAVGTNPVNVAGIDLIYDGFADLAFGTGLGMEQGGWNGYAYELEMRNTIGGTIVSSPNFGLQPVNVTEFRDANGRLWMLVNDAELEVREKPNADFFNVDRSRDDGKTWEHFRYGTGLLFSDNVAANAMPVVMRDHEVPVNRPIMYRAEAVSIGLGFDANSVPLAPVSAELEGFYVWIKDTIDSSKNRSFRVTDKWLDIQHTRNRRVYQPIGRDFPVVIRGHGMADQFNITFLLISEEEHEILHDLIDSDHLLFLQTPKGSWWVEVVNTMELRTHLWDALHGEEDVYIMKVPFQEVDRLRDTPAQHIEAGGGH